VRLCAGSGVYGKGGCRFTLSGLGSQRSEVRGMNREVNNGRGNVESLKMGGGCQRQYGGLRNPQTFSVKTKFHAEFQAISLLFSKIF